jgi:peptidoglycan/xylan/chitin deacetylase (PgdA/CDA1 family)
LGVTLFNFSPGSGSNRDYIPESDERFASSRAILAYEQNDPHGLNGFLLLLHLGANRKDKLFLLLEELVTRVRDRGYSFVRVDEMLRAAAAPALRRFRAE